MTDTTKVKTVWAISGFPPPRWGHTPGFLFFLFSKDALTPKGYCLIQQKLGRILYAKFWFAFCFVYGISDSIEVQKSTFSLYPFDLRHILLVHMERIKAVTVLRINHIVLLAILAWHCYARERS